MLTRYLKDVILYAPLIVVVLLFTGHFIGLPVAMIFIMGRSMEPTFYAGDVVVLIRGEPHVGDVVLWCRTKMYCIIHRVVEISGDYIVTKGDNMPVPDPPIPRNRVEYVAVAYVPRLVLYPSLGVGVFFVARRIGVCFRGLGRNARILMAFALLHIPFVVIIYVLPFSPVTLNDVVNIPRIGLAMTTQNKSLFTFIFKSEDNQYIEEILYAKCGDSACNAVLESPHVIAVNIPYSVFVESCNRGLLSVDVEIAAKCRIGTLYLNSRIPVDLSELDTKLAGDYLRLCNSDPVPVNALVKYECFPNWCYANTTLQPYSCDIIELEKATGKVYVIYRICGGRQRLIFAGWVKQND